MRTDIAGPSKGRVWPKEHARGKNAPLSMPVNLLPLACDILE